MTNAFASLIGALFSRLLVLFLTCTSLAAAAEVTVQVTRQDDAFRVKANVLVAVNQRVAWHVLTDYDKLANFVPGMRSSRIVSAPGEPLLLEQKGETGFFLFRIPIEVVSRIEETPLNTIRFQSVGGNLKNQGGEWALERHDHVTRVSYRADITPGFPLPPLLGPAIVGRDVRIMVESVANEMLQRAGSTGPATPVTPAAASQ
jgi:carbon monoxide dehydrogenase subunit G